MHCPAGASHVIVGATRRWSWLLGARVLSTGPDWGAYPVDEAAGRHGASVEQETNDPEIAYARFPKSDMTRYQAGLLPGH